MTKSYGAHISVLREAVLTALAPCDGEVFVDMTFGAGGYSAGILATCGTKVIGIDRDPIAIQRARGLSEKFAGRLRVIETPFADIEETLEALKISAVDGIVFDLGVSSWQLDEAARGFSFMHDGPLDMRMDGQGGEDARAGGISARELLEKATEKDLGDIFYILGQEKKSRSIAQAIVAARKDRQITRTCELADIVKHVTGERYREKIHPATRVFQAIRIFINDELGQLAKALFAAEAILKPSGRLCLVTFHSLEDRIVKRFLATGAQPGKSQSRHLPIPEERHLATFSLADRRPQVPIEEEILQNPRARSAKLRLGVRTTAPARICTSALLKELGVPQLRLATSFRS